MGRTRGRPLGINLCWTSRSGFYAWRGRVQSEAPARAVKRTDLDVKVRNGKRSRMGPLVRRGCGRSGPEMGPALTGRPWPRPCAGKAWKGFARAASRRPIRVAWVHSIPDRVARKRDTGGLEAGDRLGDGLATAAWSSARCGWFTSCAAAGQPVPCPTRTAATQYSAMLESFWSTRSRPSSRTDVAGRPGTKRFTRPVAGSKSPKPRPASSKPWAL